MARTPKAGVVSQQKTGRPSKYSKEIGARICEMVAERIPVCAICSSEDMPDVSTLYRWKRNYPEFREDYMRAREERADARQDYIDTVVQEARLGVLDVQVARLIIDAEKWQMGKERPKQYGDKFGLEGSGEGGAIVIQMVGGDGSL